MNDSGASTSIWMISQNLSAILSHDLQVDVCVIGVRTPIA